MGQDIRARPMLALLLLVVLVAIGCVLWFMREAMQNERLAARQKIAEAYQGQLAQMVSRAEEQWRRKLDALDREEPGPRAFANAARDAWADAVIFLDPAGKPVYPQAETSTRNPEANGDLFALEQVADRSDPRFAEIANRLTQRLTNYESAAIPSPQRRFLMREMQRIAPGAEFPTLAAEDLGARYLEANPSPILEETLRPTSLPDIWARVSPGRRALALFSTATLRARLSSLVHEPALAPGVEVTPVAPGEDVMSEATVVTGSLAPLLPGWRLALTLDDRALFDSAAQEKVTRYIWIGSAVVAAMAVLGVVIARGFGRQVRLARLKNDLVATVSHELKTPLTAMRALVDTLLDTERFDEKTTREYLQLLSGENARLSRLIDNFLTFSRLERNKFSFKFAPLRPQQIVDGAVAAMGERCQLPACRFESQIEPDLPTVMADRDALTTALLNLLDNAWKYTGEEKRITLRAERHNGSVHFAVQDNGIGLPARETRRVFERFYQVDRRLSRDAGGCGLGLSIVQSIVNAHDGKVSVTSEPGAGSTFVIEIPAIST